MASNRIHFRNVQFYDGSDPDILLGGLVQNGCVTERNFLQMLGVVLVTEAPIRVQHRTSGQIVTISDSDLQVGIYDVYCNSEYFVEMLQLVANLFIGPIQVTDEMWIHRIQSFNVSGRDDAFREGIRTRDGKCVISGMVNRRAPYNWARFEAAHIFPLEAENLWIQWDYGRWITDMDDAHGISKINSCQNGFLLRADLHNEFDQYLWSVNPDVSKGLR